MYLTTVPFPRVNSYTPLVTREGGSEPPPPRSIPWIGGVVAAIIIGLPLIYLAVRSYKRRQRNLSKLGYSGNVFRQIFSSNRTAYQQPDADASEETPSNPTTTVTTTTTNISTPPSAQISQPINRNTSIRSILTLPAYRETASNSERVLGREGDRDGIDVVVEQVTPEHEEALRVEEMESLYQVRMLRRQQIADRNERRRQRQEARGRNDNVALEEIRRQTRSDTSGGLLDELRREHDRIKDQRNRSASSVSYANLGVARHDGTRVRANSNDSEQVGLLSDVASVAAISTTSRSDSFQQPLPLQATHQREGSVNSVFSADSDVPRANRGRADSDVSHTDNGLDTVTSGINTPYCSNTSTGLQGSLPPPGYEDISNPPGEDPPLYSGSPELRSVVPASDHSVPRLPSIRLSNVPKIVIEPLRSDRDNDSRDQE